MGCGSSVHPKGDDSHASPPWTVVGESGPFEIVTEREDGKFVVSAGFWSALSPVNVRELPLVSVAVFGRRREGKSTLLNYLTLHAAASPNRVPGPGFDVGDSLGSCTRGVKGLLQHVRFDDASGAREAAVLFIDTQGADAVDTDPKDDVPIMAFAALLAPTLVYNSKGVIGRNQLDVLSVALRTAASECQSLWRAPALTFLFRDFYLSLPEGCPDISTFVTTHVLTSNDGGQYIKSSVASADGDGLPSPAIKGSSRNTADAPWGKLPPAFREGLNRVLAALWGKALVSLQAGTCVSATEYMRRVEKAAACVLPASE